MKLEIEMSDWRHHISDIRDSKTDTIVREEKKRSVKLTPSPKARRMFLVMIHANQRSLSLHPTNMGGLRRFSTCHHLCCLES